MIGGKHMEAQVTTGLTRNKELELLRKMIVTEVDLGYDKRQNVLMSGSVDGCNRISYCSCDCNDSSW